MLLENIIERPDIKTKGNVCKYRFEEALCLHSQSPAWLYSMQTVTPSSYKAWPLG